MVCNYSEQEELPFIPEFRIALKLPVYTFYYGIVGRDVISFALSKTELEHLLILIKLGIPVLDLCTNNLSNFSIGW